MHTLHISEIAQQTHSTETFISKIASIGYWLAMLYFSAMRKLKNYLIAVFEVTKGPDILQTKSKNELIWPHFEKIRPKRSSFEFVPAVRNSSPKQTFWGSSFWLLNTFELPLVRGDYAIGGCVLELHLLWCAIFFPRLISHSTEVRQENNISKSLAT